MQLGLLRLADKRGEDMAQIQIEILADAVEILWVALMKSRPCAHPAVQVQKSGAGAAWSVAPGASRQSSGHIPGFQQVVE